MWTFSKERDEYKWGKWIFWIWKRKKDPSIGILPKLVPFGVVVTVAATFASDVPV